MAYLHLGNDIDVHIQDVIGIFDIEKTTINKQVNESLKKTQKSGEIYYVSLDLPKSFIVLNNKNNNSENRTFISNVSVYTLNKRLKKYV